MNLCSTRDRIVQQLIAHADLRLDVDAVLGNGVVGLLRGLQPQVVEVELVPRPDDVEAFFAQFARIEHRAAADPAPAIDVDAVEALPQHADLAARHRDHDVGPEHDGDQQARQHHDGQARQMAPDMTPPPRRRRGGGGRSSSDSGYLAIHRSPAEPYHQPIVRCSTIRPSSMRIRRAGRCNSSR